MNPSDVSQPFQHINNISKIINKHDPIHLLKTGSPEDEYSPEAQIIFSLWKDYLSFELFNAKVYASFYTQFRDILEMNEKQFYPLSRELWSYLKRET